MEGWKEGRKVKLCDPYLLGCPTGYAGCSFVRASLHRQSARQSVLPSFLPSGGMAGEGRGTVEG